MKLAAGLGIALNMCLWEEGPGLRAFGTNQGFAAPTKFLARKQGFNTGIRAPALFSGPLIGIACVTTSPFLRVRVAPAGVRIAARASWKIPFSQSNPVTVGLVPLHAA